MAEKSERPKRVVKSPSVIQDEIDRIASGPKVVTVACKLPNGLLLRLFDWGEQVEPVVGGGTRVTRISRPRTDTVSINGNSVPMNGMAPPFTVIDAHRRGDGFGLTHNVDAEFFAEWMRQNKDAPYVKEGLIWAYADMNSVTDRARDNEAVKSGLEPLDPEGDSRAPRQIQPGTRTAA